MQAVWNTTIVYSQLKMLKKFTKNNITFAKDDIEKMYEKLFSKALDEYNNKQTRADRKIPNYYEHIKNSKQEKLFYEAVVQYGNLENESVGSKGGAIAAEMLKEYMTSFEKRNPQLKVFNAVLHLDEATPHLHIDFIPIGVNQTRGLSTRVSLKKANMAARHMG